MAIEPIRFVDDPGMLFTGIRRVHPYRSAPQTIPEQWREFQAQMPTIPGRVETESYGVMCANFEASQSFEYMTAVRVEAFDSATAVAVGYRTSRSRWGLARPALRAAGRPVLP